MYGDTDEFPEAIVFEEDEWLVEGEKRSLNFKGLTDTLVTC